MWSSNTPGTLVALLGAILLLLSTLSVPILSNIYFLTANVQATVSSVTIAGNIKLGVFGYCIVVGAQKACSRPSIGYDLQPGSLVSLPPQAEFGLPNGILQALTYVLILHPIAAGLAFLAVISGIFSHFSRFSRSCYTSCLSSMAAAAALLAAAFDVVAFIIARNRINRASIASANAEATLGPAVLVTIAGWIALACSSCFFITGRCLLRRRNRQQVKADTLRPSIDTVFATEMRKEAFSNEPKPPSTTGHQEPALPAFAEYGSEQVYLERIPLNRMEGPEEDRSNPPGRDRSLERDNSLASHSLAGIGAGYGPRLTHLPQMPSVGGESEQSFFSGSSDPFHAPSRSLAGPQSTTQLHHRAGGAPANIYGDLPPHVTPAASSMSSPPKTSRTLYPQSHVPFENTYVSLAPPARVDNAYHTSPSFSQPGGDELMQPTYERPTYSSRQPSYSQPEAPLDYYWTHSPQQQAPQDSYDQLPYPPVSTQPSFPPLPVPPQDYSLDSFHHPGGHGNDRFGHAGRQPPEFGIPYVPPDEEMAGRNPYEVTQGVQAYSGTQAFSQPLFQDTTQAPYHGEFQMINQFLTDLHHPRPSLPTLGAYDGIGSAGLPPSSHPNAPSPPQVSAQHFASPPDPRPDHISFENNALQPNQPTKTPPPFYR